MLEYFPITILGGELVNTKEERFKEIEEEFKKQRRNVMITASIIILIYCVGIRITNINLGVTGLSFENSEVLFHLLQIALAYFLLRFFVLYLKVRSIENPKIYNIFYETIYDHILIRYENRIQENEINEFSEKTKKKLTTYFNYYLFEKDFTFDFLTLMKAPSALTIFVTKKDLDKEYKQIIKKEVVSLVGFINYILPMIFAILVLGITLLPKEKEEPQSITSFKDKNTSIQIKEYCNKNFDDDSLKYKKCVKYYEKKLY